MTTLNINQDPDYHLIRIIEVNENQWEFIIGPWYQNKRDNENKLKKQIYMNCDNLVQLSNEMFHLVNKPKDSVFLLPSRTNSPKIKVVFTPVKNTVKSPNKKGKICLSFKVNINDRELQYSKDDDNKAYLYEGEGAYIGMDIYFNKDTLLQFAIDLETEARKHQKSFWQQVKEIWQGESSEGEK
ncbi:MAG: hypothetical protein KDI30_07080 [Pseudomonadales bacterium]|nr:hypothetical protein [Pseudomonadales bacterium]